MKKKKYQRFCTNCGWVQLKLICPRCGAIDLPEAIFWKAGVTTPTIQSLELRNYQ